MYQVTFGDHSPGLPPELDGALVKVLRWNDKPVRHARCVTDEGLVYNVAEPCLVEVTDVIVVEEEVEYTGVAKVLHQWGLTGEEGVDQLEAMFTRAKLTDLLEDLYPLPAELRVKRKDTKPVLAQKIFKAVVYRAG